MVFRWGSELKIHFLRIFQFCQTNAIKLIRALLFCIQLPYNYSARNETSATGNNCSSLA